MANGDGDRLIGGLRTISADGDLVLADHGFSWMLPDPTRNLRRKNWN